MESLARDRLGSFPVFLTTGPGDATRIARQQLRRGAELIVCVGGDGTLNEVVNGFMQREGPVREDAMRLTGRLLTVDRSEAVPLEEGEFYTFDIIGLTVYDGAGTELGTVENVLRTGSNDVYQARRPDGRELLIPALKAVVKEIDVAGGRMVVDLPEETDDAH